MLSTINEEKIKKFFNVVMRLAEKSVTGQTAIIIAKKEDSSSVINSAGLVDKIIYLKTDRNSDDIEVAEVLAKAIKNGKMVILEIGEFLSPLIYNDIYLFSKAGRIEYNTSAERVVANSAKGASLVLFINEDNLNKLNYDNLLNIVGLVERI